MEFFIVATLVTVVNLVWLLTTVLGLPGPWLMLATAGLVTWLQWGTVGDEVRMFGWSVLVAGLVLALLGELVEFVAGMAGAKVGGGSTKGAIGAIIGTIVGGIVGIFIPLLPVVGSLIFACVGAAVGTVIMELRGGGEWSMATRAGGGAAVGRLGGTLGKLAFGVVIWLLLAVAAYWP
jgi:hypothetical protein